VPDETPKRRPVKRPVEDPVLVAREVLGDSPQADAVSAALERLAEARERLGRETAAAPSLSIQLRSQVPKGSIVVYSRGRQIFQRRFSFVERKGLLRRQGVPGELSERVELEVGDHELLVYVMRRREQARLTKLSAHVTPGAALLLEILVPVTGDPEVRLR
jgi:hypothetical protein